MSAAGPARHLDELPVEHCWQLLRQHTVGRVAVAVAGPGESAPVVHAVDYVVDGGTIVFRTVSAVVLEAVAVGAIAFEVDVLDPGHTAGWSVLVRGRATVGEAHADLPPQPWAGGDRPTVVRLEAAHVTGRWVHPGEPNDASDGRGYL